MVGLETYVQEHRVLLAAIVLGVLASAAISPPLARQVRIPALMPFGVLGGLVVVIALATGNFTAYTLWVTFSMSPTFGPGVALVTAFCLAVAFPFARVLRVRTGLAAACTASIGLPLVFSAFPRFGYPYLRPEALTNLQRCLTDPSGYLPDRWQLVLDVFPNIVLYLPLGMLLTSAFRRPRPALVLAASLAAGVEFYQAVFTDRTCQPSDVVSDLLGASAGALVALGLAHLGRRFARPLPTASPDEVV